MLSKNIKYLVGVDHIRGMAALLVLLYHSTSLIGADIAHDATFYVAQIDYGYTQWNIFKSLISEGSFGVALFMTLSGFIFAFGLYKKEVKLQGFFRNRLVRIYPLYIFLIFLSIYLYPSLQSNPLESIVLSIFPFFNLSTEMSAIITTGVIASAGMFWTIAVECQFYLVFPFLMKFLNEHKFKLLWGIILLFTVLRLFAYLSGDVNMSSFGYYSIFGRMDEFLIGMMAAYFFIRKKKFLRRSPRMHLALSTTSLILMLFIINRVRHYFGFAEFENFYVILPPIEGLVAAYFIISYVGIFQNKTSHWLSQLLAKLGELSYSMYLTHFMIIVAVVFKLSLPNVLGNWWWSALFYGICLILPLTIGLSLMTYNFIEKPFLQLRKKYVIDKKPEAAQQAV